MKPLIALLACVGVFVAHSSGAEGAKPNVLILVADDLGCADVGFNGSKVIATPNLDRLAANSVVFPEYIANGFPTAPAQFAFTCSAWPHGTLETFVRFPKTQFDALPARLRELGYRTARWGSSKAEACGLNRPRVAWLRAACSTRMAATSANHRSP